MARCRRGRRRRGSSEATAQGFVRARQRTSEAQMRQTCAPVVETEEDVLAATPDLFKARPAQTQREPARRALRREAGAKEYSLRDARAAQQPVERARDEFDFREFGHV